MGDDCKDCKVNHASLVVGYNLEAEIPYFLLKNAWGQEWGEEGYYKFPIGELTKQNQGVCKMASTDFMVVPIIG